MPIYMTETAISNVAATLRSFLAAELAQIDAAKADGITLDVPAASDILEYALTPQTFTPSNIIIEVFCDSSTITEWHPAEVSAGTLRTEHQVTVRTTILDRTTSDPATLRKRVDRTVAALHRVLSIEKFDLSGTVEICEPIGTDYRNLEGDLQARQAASRFRVVTREVNA